VSLHERVREKTLLHLSETHPEHGEEDPGHAHVIAGEGGPGRLPPAVDGQAAGYVAHRDHVALPRKRPAGGVRAVDFR